MKQFLFSVFATFMFCACAPSNPDAASISLTASGAWYNADSKDLVFMPSDDSFLLGINAPAFLEDSGAMVPGSYNFGGSSYYEEGRASEFPPVRYTISGVILVSETNIEDTGHTVRIEFSLNGEDFIVLADSFWQMDSSSSPYTPHVFTPTKAQIQYYGSYYFDLIDNATYYVYMLTLSDPQVTAEMELEVYADWYKHPGEVPVGRYEISMSRRSDTALAGHKFADEIQGCHYGARLLEKGEIIITEEEGGCMITIITDDDVRSYSCPYEYVDCTDPAVMAVGEPDTPTTESWTLKGDGEYIYCGTSTAAYYHRQSHEYVLDLYSKTSRIGLFLLLYSPTGGDDVLPSMGDYVVELSVKPFTANPGYCFDLNAGNASLVYKTDSSGSITSWWMLGYESTIKLEQKGSSYMVTLNGRSAKGSTLSATFTGTITKGKSS
ncbi:MAG: hypothetical protein K6A62_03915 [Bacteroidales bacterium]|nr:hypothetical protein [Bacteroidales bacterium]